MGGYTKYVLSLHRASRRALYHTFASPLLQQENEVSHNTKSLIDLYDLYEKQLRKDFSEKLVKSWFFLLIVEYFAPDDWENSLHIEWVAEQKSDSATEVIGFPCANSHVVKKLCDEVELNFAGIYSGITSTGPGKSDEQMVFLGWEEKKVKRAVKEYDEGSWGLSLGFTRKIPAHHMSFSIHETSTPGLYQGDYDFGVVSGVIIPDLDREELFKYVEEMDNATVRSRQEEDMEFLNSV
ncbi:hypothetical protein QBC38DRAFT_439576 [Podospora fimiseda]|uniref:Uncharacterized protein n=1 Tax=Podospora fimiseda TaxID=252190 RepID=A0AAN7H843_9PEZI|nr:hypothetical protein QBC38DRAFT_439576 [Podospora fimiseda]